MKAAGIILAAGRGSRMQSLTDTRPKCLLELAGKTLLSWQESALKAAGITDLLAVKGYMADSICGDFETCVNPRWAETNMLATMLCASPFIDREFAAGAERIVISYSDIVYHPDHVTKLLLNRDDIAITYDTLWEALWTLRFTDVLSDAETFLQKDGRLLEIGEKPESLAEIHGQYMGLLSCSARGWSIIKTLCEQPETDVDKTDMTSFLRILLANKIPVGAVPVAGRWCEADSARDLELYERAIDHGNWTHDWRIKGKI